MRWFTGSRLRTTSPIRSAETPCRRPTPRRRKSGCHLSASRSISRFTPYQCLGGPAAFSILRASCSIRTFFFFYSFFSTNHSSSLDYERRCSCASNCSGSLGNRTTTIRVRTIWKKRFSRRPCGLLLRASGARRRLPPVPAARPRTARRWSGPDFVHHLGLRSRIFQREVRPALKSDKTEALLPLRGRRLLRDRPVVTAAWSTRACCPPRSSTSTRSGAAWRTLGFPRFSQNRLQHGRVHLDRSLDCHPSASSPRPGGSTARSNSHRLFPLDAGVGYVPCPGAVWRRRRKPRSLRRRRRHSDLVNVPYGVMMPRKTRLPLPPGDGRSRSRECCFDGIGSNPAETFGGLRNVVPLRGGSRGWPDVHRFAGWSRPSVFERSSCSICPACIGDFRPPSPSAIGLNLCSC